MKNFENNFKYNIIALVQKKKIKDYMKCDLKFLLNIKKKRIIKY